MPPDQPLSIFIGWDAREAIASDVAAFSIRRRTESPTVISYLKHMSLRRAGLFRRPWLVDALTGEWVDLMDNKRFSTEFSHTRFLVPSLMGYKGWALFMDSDMLFLSDVKKLFDLADDRYAVMCVKHNHKPKHDEIKMDGRVQQAYPRKNWSSFVMFNCGHPGNRTLTKERVNVMRGSELHGFSWLRDDEIGELPPTYNFISGVSPKMPPESGGRPDVIHFTDGGPWFRECPDVPYGQMWVDEYEDWQRSGHAIASDVPTTRYESARDVIG